MKLLWENYLSPYLAIWKLKFLFIIIDNLLLISYLFYNLRQECGGEMTELIKSIIYHCQCVFITLQDRKEICFNKVARHASNQWWYDFLHSGACLAAIKSLGLIFE